MGEPTGQDKDANSALQPREGADVAEFDPFASNYEETLAKVSVSLEREANTSRMVASKPSPRTWLRAQP
jgi:hypothetical protein